ncbi:hypothetical protein [Bailinhaonella thermotolerans]|uniref:hypothetical protein n=1 Tax=Bailinhaonella thermotolerans TaxID=1070861 RepID=UPI0011C41A58|nr:hypothetical protein [Bailinhaonella thermotolerans]
MMRWWDDPEIVLAPEDLRRLEALAALYPHWAVTRRPDRTWVASRLSPPAQRQREQGIVGELAHASLARVSERLAEQDRLASALRLGPLAGHRKEQDMTTNENSPPATDTSCPAEPPLSSNPDIAAWQRALRAMSARSRAARDAARPGDGQAENR